MGQGIVAVDGQGYVVRSFNSLTVGQSLWVYSMQAGSHAYRTASCKLRAQLCAGGLEHTPTDSKQLLSACSYIYTLVHNLHILGNFENCKDQIDIWINLVNVS